MPMIGASETMARILAATFEAHPLIGRRWCGCAGGPEPVGVSLGEIDQRDWSTKTETGRECRTRIVVRLERSEAEAMAELCGRIEAAGQLDCGPIMLGLQPTGWRLVGVQLLRTRQTRLAQGGRRAEVEHRYRLLAE